MKNSSDWIYPPVLTPVPVRTSLMYNLERLLQSLLLSHVVFLISVTCVLSAFLQCPFSLLLLPVSFYIVRFSFLLVLSILSAYVSLIFSYHTIISSPLEFLHFCFLVFFHESGCSIKFFKFLAKYLVRVYLCRV